MPAEFVARKGSYWRGVQFVDARSTSEHIAQMTAALEAARKK
jgi:hypothetical protein